MEFVGGKRRMSNLKPRRGISSVAHKQHKKQSFCSGKRNKNGTETKAQEHGRQTEEAIGKDTNMNKNEGEDEDEDVQKCSLYCFL